MARQEINLGTAPTGAGGDTTRTTGVKINAMTTELYARNALLGTASNRNVGIAVGNIQDVGAPAAMVGNSAFAEVGSHFVAYGDNTTNAPSTGVYWSGIRAQFPFQNAAMDLVGQVLSTGSMNLMFRTVAGSGIPDAWRKIYHDGNTTRAADGTLKAI
jgi:hypothetical protein